MVSQETYLFNDTLRRNVLMARPEASEAELDAVIEAGRLAGNPAPRRPWRDVLPEVVTVDELLSSPDTDDCCTFAGRYVPIGLADVPGEVERVR